ncbi:uncharacterized protein LOC132552820 [Ylistrum balloti]|uniref:uncharacterized protein LOC132552820 n=1 Tax=Ylistrum balloti TaxID=509963 RepID=UPI002905838F|nr:uncharacterized protein LOC132552820 [Ylistrum balloti]
MVQGNSSPKRVMSASRRKNPSQLAESEAKETPRQARVKKSTSKFERGVQNMLETSETLVSGEKSEKKSSKNSRKSEYSNEKRIVNLKDVKNSSVKENIIGNDKLTSSPKLIASRDLRKASIGSHDSMSYRPLRPVSGPSDRLVRPGSEDSVSSTIRQERERLSSRKDSSYSTYIEITHNASEDLIVVENADSDWSNSDDLIPEVEEVDLQKSKPSAKPEVDEKKTEKESNRRRKRRPRTRKKKEKLGRRSKSANDGDEFKARADHVIVTDLEHITQEVPAEPVYVPHDIWVPKRRMREKGKQTMVRVGGGFMDLSYYLHHHVPIKVYQPKPYAQLFNKHMFMVKSKRPELATGHKHYDRPSWTTMNKGFKAFACI